MDGVYGDDLRLSLAEFANDVFAPLRRAGWRERSEVYLRALVLGEKRRRAAPAASPAPQLHEQSLNHFVSVSPWDHAPIRRKLSERILNKMTPDAWVLGHTTLYKYGEMLAGVARQDTGVPGRVANCQVGISTYLAAEDASCPVNWRLFLPECWDPELAGPGSDVLDMRARTGIPDSVRYRPKWQLAMDALDEMATWGIRPPVVVADHRLGGHADLVHALEARAIPYLVEVGPTATARPETGPPERLALRGIVMADDQIGTQVLGWRHPVKGRNGQVRTTQSRFIFVRVRDTWSDALRRNTTAEPSSHWLIAEWPAEKQEPTGYWLSDLPAETALSRLARLTKLQWRVSRDEHHLVDELGLGRYKGRTMAGWHHHVTLVSAAHAFRALQHFERTVPAQLRSRQLSYALR